MTNRIEIVKGADIPLTITIENTIINDLNNLIIYFYCVENGIIVTKFSIVSILGYESIEVIDSPNGIVDIIVPNTHTKYSMNGDHKCSFKTIKTDGDFPDGFDDDMEIVDGIVLLINNPISFEAWQS